MEHIRSIVVVIVAASGLLFLAVCIIALGVHLGIKSYFSANSFIFTNQANEKIGIVKEK